MKVHIELTDGTAEDEVIIRCARVDDDITRLFKTISGSKAADIGFTFYKDDTEYYFPLDNILFFETEGEHLYAHTAVDAFLIKYRLYELLAVLPQNFVRASKSGVVNLRQIYSITRNLTASSPVRFHNSNKTVYVSRHYYNELRLRLNERSQYEK